MNLSAEDIRILAQTITAIDRIDSTTSFNWVKDAIKEIVSEYPSAAPYFIETFDVQEKYGSYKPIHPIVLIDKIVECRENSLVETIQYELHGNELFFINSGKFQIRYHGMPDMPETKTQAINMPIQFVDAIKFYVAWKIRARLFNQEDVSAKAFYDEYDKALKKANTFMMKRERRPKNTMPPGTKKV